MAIYHVVYGHEGFEEAAQTLFRLVQRAQETRPGKARKVFLDIEAHRNSQGGFDSDMYELQSQFLRSVLLRFVSEIHCPLFSATNADPQDNDLPPRLIILDPRRPEEKDEHEAPVDGSVP